MFIYTSLIKLKIYFIVKRLFNWKNFVSLDHKTINFNLQYTGYVYLNQAMKFVVWYHNWAEFGGQELV